MLKLLNALVSFLKPKEVVEEPANETQPKMNIPEMHHYFSVTHNTAHGDFNISYTGVRGVDRITQHIMDMIEIHQEDALYSKLYNEISIPGKTGTIIEYMYRGVKHVIHLDKQSIFLY